MIELLETRDYSEKQTSKWMREYLSVICFFGPLELLSCLEYIIWKIWRTKGIVVFVFFSFVLIHSFYISWSYAVIFLLMVNPQALLLRIACESYFYWANLLPGHTKPSFERNQSYWLNSRFVKLVNHISNLMRATFSILHKAGICRWSPQSYHSNFTTYSSRDIRKKIQIS